ncbi:MAG TPA: cupin domain-containing protein [Rhabdochlamydiaceae bacterium]|nr:cupin domain-containing protein [Rhabdochlamydiaceae bacterium]
MSDPVSIEQILRTSKAWDGSLLPGFSSGQTEMRVLIFKIAPGAKTTIHMHPLNGAGYLITGELTMFATEDPHGSFADHKKIKKIKLSPGDAWAEAVNIWHYGENTGKTEVKFVLIFAGQEETPPTLSLGTRIK